MNSKQCVLTKRFGDALLYSFEVHGEQTRKGKSVPYLAHLLSVCALVLEDGGDEDEAIAALLHDALEDHPDKTSPTEIEGRFGSHVLELVRGCSDTPTDYKGGQKPPWRPRKEAYLEHLRESHGAVVRIALADKLHNARDILADYRKDGNAIWLRFNAPKPDQLWLFRSLVSAFRQGGASGPMFEDFQRVVAELEVIP